MQKDVKTNPATPDRSEPRLPPELLREIFELAVHGASLKALSDVAPYVKQWVKPLYYTKGSVFWGSYPSPPEIAYVKSLVVERGARPTTLQEYLPNCYNLEELTVLDRGVLSQDTLPLIESLLQSPLRRTSWSSLHTLKASLRALFQGHFIQDEGGNTHIDFTHPVIKNLRRLGLLYDKEWSNPSSWVDGNNFGCLSSLRYLRFDEAVCFEVIINILRECNSLELVIFGVNTGGWYERLPRTKKKSCTRPLSGSRLRNGGPNYDDDDVDDAGYEPDHRALTIPRHRTWASNLSDCFEFGLSILEARRSGKGKRIARRRSKASRELCVGNRSDEDWGLNLLYD